MSGDDLYTVLEAAAVAKVHRRTIERRIADKTLEVVRLRISDHPRITGASLARYLGRDELPPPPSRHIRAV